MALDFDGTDDFANHTGLGTTGLGAFTMSFWLWKDTEAGGDARQGIMGDSNGPYMEIDYLNAGCVLCYFHHATSYGVTANGVITLNTWQHHALVFDGSQADNATRWRYFLDHTEKTLTYAGTIAATLPTSNDVWYVMRALNVNYGNGKIANIKCWSAALTAAERLNEAVSWRPCRTSGLLLWAPYDDATSAKDYSGNANHGSLTSAPTQVIGPPIAYGLGTPRIM